MSNSPLQKIKQLGNLKILKNFSNLVFGNLVYQIFNLISLVYIARRLKTEGFGEFSYLLVQGQLFATIASLGIKNIVIRNIARDLKQTNSIFAAGMLLQGIGFVISLVILLIYSWLISSYDILTFVVLAINIFSLNFWDTSEAVYMAHQKMLYPGVLKSITLVIWIVFLLLIPNRLFTQQMMFISYTVVLFANILIAYVSLKQAKLLAEPITNLRQITTSIFSQSFPYFILVVVNLPVNFLANNFLKINSSNIELGYFNTSNRLTQPIKLITSLALLSFFPNVSVLWSNNKERFRIKIQQLTPLFINLLLVLSALFSIFSKEIILIVFGKEYLPAAFIFKYQVWFVFLFTVQGLIGTLWMASDKQRLLSVCGVVNAIVCTPVLWYGSLSGARGEAIAYFLSYAFLTPLLFIVFFKSLGLDFKALIEPLIICTLTICGCLILPGSYTFIIRCFVFAAVFAVSFYFNYNRFNTFLKNKGNE